MQRRPRSQYRINLSTRLAAPLMRVVRQPRLSPNTSIYWCIMAKIIETAPIKPTITIDVLNKIDVRVGTIELVEDVGGSNKLVKLTVDFGDHKRTILAGMKQERQQPKEIEGKQALFVVNLEQKQMMGEVSEGMLFDIGYADGIIPELAIPEKQVPNGARVG
jgi:tRNA-binding protein